MPVNSKRKGARGEREAAAVLNEVLGVNGCHRAQQFKGTADSADVEGFPGLHLEVKRCQRLNVPEALARCAGESAACDVPTLLHRRNREPWLLTIYLSDLPRLAERIGNLCYVDTIPGEAQP